MALTTTEYLTKYSKGTADNAQEAYTKAMATVTEGMADNSLQTMQSNLWKYGKNGVLQKVPQDQSGADAVMEDMLRGVVYVLPGLDEEGQLDFTQMQTLTAAQHKNQYYVQVMDAAKVKDAYENRPLEAPGFLDKLVDFFCWLVGKRDKVCALWDELNTIQGVVQKSEKLEQQNELMNRDFSRADARTEEEKEIRKQQAKDLIQNRQGIRYREQLTEWYLALYGQSKEFFPAFISDDAQVEMTRLDADALKFAEGKLEYKEGAHYRRSEDLEGVLKGFDVRVSIVTTLAFALTAQEGLPAADVFKFLRGEPVPGTDGLAEKMKSELEKINDPATRNSPNVKSLLQAGTTRICTELENQADLQNGISYQLGRLLSRNLLAFNPHGNPKDPSVDLVLSPVAKQIMNLQDQVISSYESGILQGFVLDLSKNDDGPLWAGSTMTNVMAPGMLPVNVVGQTNAAFLEKLSQQPAGERRQFLKEKLHLLEEMNENLCNYVRKCVEDIECAWTQSPEDLKKALNGGMIKDYQKAVMKSLRETGEMPVYKNTLDEKLELQGKDAIDGMKLTAKDDRRKEMTSNDLLNNL